MDGDDEDDDDDNDDDGNEDDVWIMTMMIAVMVMTKMVIMIMMMMTMGIDEGERWKEMSHEVNSVESEALASGSKHKASECGRHGGHGKSLFVE